MSVKVRRYRRGGWEVDIAVLLPDGTRFRERKKASVSSLTGARRWGEARERELLRSGPARVRKEVPTPRDSAPRFLEGYARANRQKPSGIAGKETILRVHLVPALGARHLDAITTEDVQRLKRALENRSPKTVNNVLTVLNTLLKQAVAWDVIETVPCTIRLLKAPRAAVRFHDFEAFERLVVAADRLDRTTLLLVLLGGEAGLRCGEMMALEWRDVELGQRRLCVARSDWKGQVTATKGERVRYVPLTRRLERVLLEHRQLRGRRVLTQRGGTPLTQKVVQQAVARAARRANVWPGVHILRHTFCSHLTMRGAPVRAIQELAGHQNLSTTQRYMHLSPAAIDGAIRLLDQATPAWGRGDMVETGGGGFAKTNG